MAPLDGTLTVAGLQSPVEVRRDRFAVPHIRARSTSDLLFAQGWVHASDRLWQMELHRRVGHGRLSEVIGELGVSTDELVRTIGFSRAARRDAQTLTGETRALFERYVAGINAYLEQNRFTPPLEHLLLGIRPEPWRIEDSLVWGKVLGFGLALNWTSELLVSCLVAKLGVEKARELFPEYPIEHPTIVPGTGKPVFAQDTAVKILDELKRSARDLPLPAIAGMSNNWVVAGKRTESGRPLLANDPHLALQLPSIWYESHLEAPDFHVTGVSLAGIPGVLIGHNQDIAWGITAALIDTQDLFMEQFHPERLHQYKVGDEWKTATVIKEEIRVKGEPRPRICTVVETHHGPILNTTGPIADDDNAPKFALRWTGLTESFASTALFGLNRARNWDEFNAALDEWTDPALNFVYADREHIGYRMAGRIPVRKAGVGAVPVPGWTGEYDWQGFVPTAEMPRSFDPERGYLASANNQIVGADFPHFVSVHSMNGARAARIEQLLESRPKHTVESLAALQLDQFSAPALRWRDLLLRERAAVLAHPSLALVQRLCVQALDELAAWDGVLDKDSRPAAVYELFQHFALRRLFSPHLGALTDHYLGVGFHPMLAPVVLPHFDHTPFVGLHFLEKSRAEWICDSAGNPIARSALLAQSLADALSYLRQTLGEDTAKWAWGEVHPAEFHHPLGSQAPLDAIFNRGPYRYGGDVNTVWQASFVPKLPFVCAGGFTASWRQILDTSDWDRSRGMGTSGQSGHPASPHYDDQINAWLDGELHPMPFTDEASKRVTVYRLNLHP